MLTVVDFFILNMAFYATTILTPEIIHFRTRTVWLLANLTYFPVVYWLISTHKARALYMDHVMTNSLRAVSALALLYTSSLYFIGVDNIPWTSFAVFYGLLFILLPLWWTISRMIIKFFRRHGRNFSRVVIVGTNSTARHLYKEMMSDAGFGYKFMGFFDNAEPADSIPPELFKGGLDHLSDFVAENAIDEIYYTLTGECREDMAGVIRTADANCIPFYYVPQLNRFVSRGFELHLLGTMPVMSVMPNPLKRMANRIMKRSFDLVFSTVALVMSPVIFIPVAIAIKISSPGPVFFRQKRTGLKGAEFYCYKFRTMRVNAQSDSMQATQNDPRKTRVGDFLRRTSIDELPQFINVWLGDMSVVGPRPHMLRHTEEYSALIEKYMVRHMVKPGITGWAQVNGFRGQTEQLWQMEKRVEHDVWYIEHWSFMLDMKIILRTILNVFHGEKNAF